MAGSSTPVRRVSAIFGKGMITDTVVNTADLLTGLHDYELATKTVGSLQRLHDCYISRTGEIIGRGPWCGLNMGALPTSATDIFVGSSNAQHHSDLGVICVNGSNTTAAAANYNGVASATAFELRCLPIENVAPAIISPTAWYTHGNSVITNIAGTTSPFELCYHDALLPSEVLLSGSGGKICKWGGGTTASVSAASASGCYWNAGSSQVSAVGTSWLTTLDVGMYLMLDDPSCRNPVSNENVGLRIAKIVSNTVVQLDRTMTTTVTQAACVAWRAQSVCVVQGGTSAASAWNTIDYRPRSIGPICYHQGRLFVAGVADGNYNSVYDYSSIRWSFTNGGATAASPFDGIDAWAPNAKLVIGGGIGGVIRGMVSLGSQMLILKSGAIFALNNSVSNTEAGTGTIEQIVNGIGAKGWQSWKNTPKGVFFADDNGLYVYNGQTVENILTNRIQMWWNAMKRGQNELVVTYAKGRLYINGGKYDLVTLVYDLELDMFFTQSTPGNRAMVEPVTLTDTPVGIFGFNNQVSWGGGAGSGVGLHFTTVSASYTLVHTEHKDFLSYDQIGTTNFDNFDFSFTNAGGPLPEIWIVFALGEDTVSEGRIVNVHANVALSQGVGDIGGAANTFCRVSIFPGALGIVPSNFVNGFFSPAWPEVVLPDTIPCLTSPTASKDRTYRLPVTEVGRHTFARVKVFADASIVTKTPVTFRVYGISIDVEPVSNISSEFASGE